MRHELRPDSGPDSAGSADAHSRPGGRVLEHGDETLALLRRWATELGFSQIGVADVDLSSAEPGLMDWLARGFHGEMHYMASHGLKRARPAELVPGTVRVITARLDYLPDSLPGNGTQGSDRADGADSWQAIEWQRLGSTGAATVSAYARGRDYHKVLRARLQKLADRLADHIGPFGHRVFTDSAPVLEVELASRSGIGWRGKHTLLLSREAGSMFFLGEIYVDLALPLTAPEPTRCGSCRACLDACPTQAIVEEGVVDARRCISYLTIEQGGAIPLALRPLMGNRVYGCDDCQLTCPWNKFARRAVVPDFDVRPHLADPTLLTLWRWDEAAFLRLTEGSAIRRIGFARWQRNLAVAMGNTLAGRLHGPATVCPPDLREALLAALRAWLDRPPELGEHAAMVAEHVAWAIEQADLSAC